MEEGGGGGTKEEAVRFLHRGCGLLWIRENARRAGELNQGRADGSCVCVCVRVGGLLIAPFQQKLKTAEERRQPPFSTRGISLLFFKIRGETIVRLN